MGMFEALFGGPNLGDWRAQDLTLPAGDLTLRVPLKRDYQPWAEIRRRSEAFLRPFEPTWPEDDLTQRAFETRISHYHAQIRLDQAYPFFIFLTPSQTLIGGITLREVRRANCNSATLGYWLGAAYARKGLMTRALTATCNFAFTKLRLERLEAACLPENRASIRVLEKAGFEREGYARAYLAIAGMRRDHLLFARLNS
jgi:[ribosomal protein S5]-alanine N-acetyltransferase